MKKSFNCDWPGLIGKVTFKNDKVMKFKLHDINNTKTYVTVCCFVPDLFTIIENSEGKKSVMTANMAESNYKDKNGNWINTYTIALEDIEIFN